MANEFYRAGYDRKRRILAAALIVAPMILVAVFFAARLLRKDAPAAKVKPRPAGARVQTNAPASGPGLARDASPAGGGRLYSREEILARLTELQGASPGASVSSAAAEGVPTKNGASSPGTGGGQAVTYVDAFNDCRYSMTVKHQLQGGVDIYVLDTYSGELRIRTNYVDSAPLSLFIPGRAAGRRRFEELVAHQSLGGVDVYVLDTFSGDIQIKSRVTQEKSIHFFENAAAAGYRRYSCTIFYNSGKLDFYVTDLVSGETRIQRGVLSAETISLFSAADRKVKGCPRFACWIEVNSGHVDFYLLDMVSGELRRRERIEDESQLPVFGRASDLGYNRFDAWVEYNAGDIDLYAQDGYSGELKYFPAIQGKKEMELFNLPADERAWQRFHSWILFNPGQVEIYTFDRSAGAMKVDKVPALQGSFRPVAEAAVRPAASSRYDAARILRLQNSGIELYVIDTYTSEVRVAKDVSEARTYSLFADGSSGL
jgi:hypothetical protein